jgi:hypothetical protein
MGLTVYVILHRIVQKNHDEDFIKVRVISLILLFLRGSVPKVL